MLQSLKKAIEAEVERQYSDLCARVQELQQKRQAMQERHDAELMRDARVCEMVAKMISKDTRPAEEEQSDEKTEEVEAKIQPDTEVMKDEGCNTQGGSAARRRREDALDFGQTLVQNAYLRAPIILYSTLPMIRQCTGQSQPFHEPFSLFESIH